MEMSVRKIRWRRMAAVALVLCLMCQTAVYADSVNPPAEPAIQAQGAVVMDAASGQILYGKNANTQYYPASITKLMTALLVIERCNLDDMVTFSKTATTNLEAGAVSLGMTEGDTLTVRQCLYALLLKSANEVGNALAEHVAGSVAAFADLMNQKAAALGCTGTHFANPHGLNDPNHYTTPRDMALIARAAFQSDVLRQIDTTLSYQLPATKNSKARTITMGHKMMYPTDSRYYEGIIGGKTGYTSKAGNTLVTGAERNGVRLIAVVMKANGTHYTDTKALLDYGFAKMSSGAVQQVQQVQQEGPGADSAAGQAQVPAAQNTGWQLDNNGWYYIKSDGNFAAGEWLNLESGYYWMEPSGYMATGWRFFDDGNWYYFSSSGAMEVNRWEQDNGKWFYLGGNGAMLKDTVTPDGYILGSDGAWIQ